MAVLVYLMAEVLFSDAERVTFCKSCYGVQVEPDAFVQRMMNVLHDFGKHSRVCQSCFQTYDNTSHDCVPHVTTTFYASVCGVMCLVCVVTTLILHKTSSTTEYLPL